MPFVIVLQLNEPIECLGRPLCIRQKLGRIGAERAEERGNLSVMPANQDVASMAPRSKLRRQGFGLFVLKSRIELEAQRRRERLKRQPGPMAVLGIRGGEQA